VQIDAKWCGQRKWSHLQRAWLNAVYYRDMVERRTTRLFDNVYGRTFETALVDHLVKHPPEGVKLAMDQLGTDRSEV
jgi:hypothetical protein